MCLVQSEAQGVNFSLEPEELRTGNSMDLPGIQAQRGPPPRAQMELIKSRNLGFMKEACDKLEKHH